MLKKIAVLLGLVLMVISLSSCGGGHKGASVEENPNLGYTVPH